MYVLDYEMSHDCVRVIAMPILWEISGGYSLRNLWEKSGKFGANYVKDDVKGLSLSNVLFLYWTKCIETA